MPACGTQGGYRAGCRCDACRDAKSSYLRAYNDRRRGRPVQPPSAGSVGPVDGVDLLAFALRPLARMPACVREVFVDVYVLGHTYDQVAVRHGLTPNTVREYACKGRARLRRQLADDANAA